MPAVTARHLTRRSHRLLLAVWLVVSLLWQPFLNTAHAAAMVTGTEVCTSAGTQWVDADGQPVAAHAHACADCCSSPVPPVLLPDAGGVAPLPLRHAAPAEPLTLQRLAAQWLAPLSRGPPAFS